MGELQGIARFRFHEGKVEEFKRLSALCLEIVRTKDTGTLQYETYFNDDESECIVLERYRDSQALLEHGEHLAHLMDAIIATAIGPRRAPRRAECRAESEVRRRRPGAALQRCTNRCSHRPSHLESRSVRRLPARPSTHAAPQRPVDGRAVVAPDPSAL